jgi:hypothetical protein
MADATYFDRVMRLHFIRVNPAPPPRRRRLSLAWEATGYAAVIFLLLVALGVFGDLK